MGNCCGCFDNEDNVLASYDPMIPDNTIQKNGNTHTTYNPPRLQEMSLFPNG